MRTELDIIAQRNWAVEEGRAEGVALGIEQLSGQLRALGVEESVIQAAVKAVQEQNPTKE